MDRNARYTDLEAVNETLGGRRDAFTALVRRHLPAARGVAFAHNGNWNDAEDAVQDAFLEAFRCLDRLRDRNKFGPWLMTIARRAALRGRDARRRATDLPGSALVPQAPAAPDVAQSELHALLRSRLDTLDAPHREALVLHYFAGKSTQEIAGLLEISQNAVKKRLQRAREALGEHLLRECADTFETKEAAEAPTQRIMALVTTASAPWQTAAAAVPVAAASGLSITAIKVLAGGLVLCAAAGLTWHWHAQDPLVPSKPLQAAAAPFESPVGQEQPVLDPAVPAPAPPEAPKEGATVQAAGDSLLVCEVAETDGEPVAGATVSLQGRLPSEGPGEARLLCREGVTGKAGEVFFDELSEDYFLVYARTKTEAVVGRVDVGQYRRERVALAPATVFEGHVRDQQGGAIAGARLVVTGRNLIERQEWQEVEAGTTGAEGTFRLVLPQGFLWGLQVKATGYATLDAGVLKRHGANACRLRPGLTAEGLVLIADTNQPAQGVAVALRSNAAPWDSRWSRSDTEGRVRFEHVAPGTYTVEVHHEILTLKTPTQTADVGERKAALIVIGVTHGAVVSGRVYDANTDAGMAGVVMRIGAWKEGRRLSRATKTDETGDYHFSGLPAGECRVDVFGSLSRDLDRRQTRQKLRLKAGEKRDAVDFALYSGLGATGRVHGRIVDAHGGPVARALVSAESFARMGYCHLERADDRGHFMIEGAPITDDLRLRAFAPGWASEESSRLTVTAEGVDAGVLTMQRTGGISGRVLGTSGKPVYVADTFIELMNVRLPGALMHSCRALHQDGKFRIPDVPAGRHGLYVDLPLYRYHSGIVMPQLEVEVHPGEQVTGLTLHIDEEAYARAVAEEENPERDEEEQERKSRQWAVKGQVIAGETGEPVTQFSLNAQRMGTSRSNVENEEGRFTIDRGEGPKVVITVVAPGYAPKTETVWADQAHDREAEVQIQIERSPVVEGVVLDTTGKAVAGATVSTGGPPEISGMALNPPVKTQLDGSFRLDSIAAGALRIYAAHPAYAVGWSEVNLMPGRTSAATITLDHGGGIEGTVTLGGTPVAKARVDFYDGGSGSMPRSVETDAAGRYAKENLCPGSVRVLVFPERRSSIGLPVHYLEQQAWVELGKTTRVDFTAEPAASQVQGRITIQGEPVDHAWVSATLESNTGLAERMDVDVDASGHYESQLLPPGEVTLRISTGTPGGTSLNTERRVTLGENEVVTEDIDFEGGGSISGAVSGLAQGEGILVAALPGAIPMPGEPPQHLGELTAQAIARTQVQDGGFVLEGLPAGTYTVRAVSLNAYDPAAETPRATSAVVTVVDGEDLRLDLSLE